MRKIKKHIAIANPEVFKTKLLLWAKQFSHHIFLDSNNHQEGNYSSYDAVLAVDAFTAIKTDADQAFKKLQDYYSATQDWIFGYLSYDLKMDTDGLQSTNYDGLLFPELYFFQPKKIFLLKENNLEVHYLNYVFDELEDDLEAIRNHVITFEYTHPNLLIQERITQQDYLQKIAQLQKHIGLGDIYEANFCMEFFSEQAQIDPLFTFIKFNEISRAPFAVYFQMEHFHLLSASPERFLRKQKNKIISQPIKGTSKRSPDRVEDQQLAHQLQTSNKERSENIMIADLVRNDLSKTALPNSVQVEELCGLYTFKQVHQLITTVVSQVADSISPVAILQSTFPMGSMTGVPKKRAMEIIEKLEQTKRSVYSGAVGYITPEGDFDFNVVIRSILYNSKNRYLSFSVGGAITYQSQPEKEYQECLIKAEAMKKVLSIKN